MLKVRTEADSRHHGFVLIQGRDQEASDSRLLPQKPVDFTETNCAAGNASGGGEHAYQKADTGNLRHGVSF
jgi:hypothetical protein